MLIRHNRTPNPRTIMRIGMVFFLLANLWPRFIHRAFPLGPDWSDGIHGLFLGLAIGTLLWSVSRGSRYGWGGMSKTCR